MYIKKLLGFILASSLTFSIFGCESVNMAQLPKNDGVKVYLSEDIKIGANLNDKTLKNNKVKVEITLPDGTKTTGILAGEKPKFATKGAGYILVWVWYGYWTQKWVYEAYRNWPWIRVYDSYCQMWGWYNIEQNLLYMENYCDGTD